MGVFRKMQFRCAGCDKAMTAKATVPEEAASAPMAPPPGWFQIDVTAQHPAVGAIGTIVLFTCSQPCAERLTRGEGPGQAMIERFKTAFLTEAPVVPTSDGG